MEISVAHSPDADDYFLFWPIKNSLIDTAGYEFTFYSLDTEELNISAIEGRFDVSAVSLATYPRIAHEYLILPHGASVGRNFGPTVISKRELKISELNSLRVGIPGRNTTAALIFSKIAPNAVTIEVPIRPYAKIFELLTSGDLDAAVVIHEGQIDYLKFDCKLILELGMWWNDNYNLPTPLGINVIKRSLDLEIEKVSQLIRMSIKYSYDHIDQIIDELFESSQRKENKLSTKTELIRYLSMYANSDSLEMQADVIQAMEVLIGKDNVFLSK